MQAPKNHQKLELWTIRQTYLPNFFSAMDLALGDQAVHRDGKGMFYYGLRQLNFLAGRTGSKGNTNFIMFTHILIVPIGIKCPFWDSIDFKVILKLHKRREFIFFIVGVV